jgi:GNAT superfamily N-acetyltransferase
MNNKSPHITILQASVSETEIITQFQVEMALETENMQLDPVITFAGVKAVMMDPTKGKYFITFHDGKPVGSMLITPEWSDWRNRTIYWIQSVYVIPEARRKGVFSALYHHLLEWVRINPEIGGIRLYVDTGNLSAQQVYSHLGMNGEHYKVFEWMK